MIPAPEVARLAVALRRAAVCAAVAHGVATPAWGQTPPTASYPIEGSAWRISPPVVSSNGPLTLTVLHDRATCAGLLADVDEVDACVPRVDPDAGTIRLALGVTSSDLTSKRLESAVLRHSRLSFARGSRTGDALPVPADHVTLEGFGPEPAGTVVVLVVDRSGSMYEPAELPDRERMIDVVRGLLQPASLDALFATADSRVMLLGFTDHLMAADGGPMSSARLLATREDFVAEVGLLLDEQGGYTHLFDALQSTLDEVLARNDVVTALQVSGTDPVVVLVTDGFHNTRARERCRDNVAPLSRLVRRIEQGQRSARAPVVHTLGFGVPLLDEVDLGGAITASSLCGPFADEPIDGVLERQGIDNATLAWLARAGGGVTAVTESARNIAQFVVGAGITRHRWYRATLALDVTRRSPFRQRIPLRIGSVGVPVSHADVVLTPSPLFELPAAGVAAAAAAVVVRVVGACLVALGLLVGGYNLRRAVLRRGDPAGDRRASAPLGEDRR